MLLFCPSNRVLQCRSVSLAIERIFVALRLYHGLQCNRKLMPHNPEIKGSLFTTQL